jgi:hypothetical protein
MNTNNGGAAYEEGRVYQAKVVDQMLAKNPEGELQLVLGVRILAGLKNDRNPGDGTVECPQQEREVSVTFVEDDDNRLRMAARDLKRLGFPDDDISRLHPDHPQCFSLLNKSVLVRMKIVNGFEYWNLAPLREQVAIGDLKRIASPLSAKLAAARQQRKTPRTKRGQDADTSGTEPQPPRATS